MKTRLKCNRVLIMNEKINSAQPNQKIKPKIQILNNYNNKQKISEKKNKPQNQKKKKLKNWDRMQIAKFNN